MADHKHWPLIVLRGPFIVVNLGAEKLMCITQQWSRWQSSYGDETMAMCVCRFTLCKLFLLLYPPPTPNPEVIAIEII